MNHRKLISGGLLAASITLSVLAARAIAEATPCYKNYQQTCCDWKNAAGYFVITDCSAESGYMCEWGLQSGNVAATFTRSPVGDEHGHLLNKLLDPAACKWNAKFCSKGVCVNTWIPQTDLSCPANAEDETSGTCPTP